MKTEDSNVTRRSVLAGMGATATLTSSVALAVSDEADPVLTLYHAWRAARDRTDAILKKIDAARSVVSERYGALYPRVQVGNRRVYDAEDPDRGYTLQPAWFYSEREIRDVYEPALLMSGKKGLEKRDAKLEEFRQEQAKYDRLREQMGLPAMEVEEEAAAEVESEACRVLRETPATTPQGAALKFRMALFYSPNEFESEVTEEETLEGASFAAVLRDLENMGGAA